MNQKRILFLLHLPPPVHGSSMVGQYIKDSEIINNGVRTEYVNLGTSDKVDEIGRGGLKKLVKYFKIIFKTIFYLITFRPQITYLGMTAKGGAFYKDVIIGFLLKLFGTKLIIHFHNKGVSINQTKRFDNFLYKMIFDGSKVILLSKHLYFDIEKYVSKENVFYCPNGIPEVNRENVYKENKEIIQLLFLSNLIESKGVFILLEALSVLKDQGVAFYCNFIGGEGDINTELFNDKVKELGLSKSVSYLGKKYGDDKDEFFKNADIFVFPTYYHNECFPLVLLEAMSHGLPVISSFEGGIPDIVEEDVTGYLIEQKNVAMLVNKLKVLIANFDLRKRMGENGYLKFKEEYTLKTFEISFRQILDKL